MEQEFTEVVNAECKDTQYKKTSMLLFLFSILGILTIALIKNLSFTEMIRGVILVLLINVILICYIGLFRERILIKNHAWWMISVSYVISIVCMYQRTSENDIPFWIIGGVLVAGIIDLNLGLVLTYSLTILSAAMFGIAAEQLIFQLLICTGMCILSSYLKKSSNVIYVLMVTATMNITLSFVFHDFNTTEVFSMQGLITVIYCLLIMLLVYALGKLTEKWIKIQEREPDCDLVQQAELAVSNEIIEESEVEEEYLEENEEIIGFSLPGIIEETSIDFDLQNMKDEFDQIKRLEEITKPDFSLLVRMQEESPKLYKHVKQIADVSRDAAIYIGVNETMAYAGGLYHEVGRLVSKNYVEEGIKLAKEYDLPDQVVDIIKQHNLKSELPTSIECAIVMLSDSIINGINFLKSKTGQEVNIEKVVENTFNHRMSKGAIDETGLTIKMYHQLKEFYSVILLP